MTHAVTGLVGDPQFLSDLAGGRSRNLVSPLACGLALMPLPEGSSDTVFVLPQAKDGDGFQYLNSDLDEVLRRASVGGRFVYFETEYWGGVGGQGAALYIDGARTFGPEWAEMGPINAALALLGVVTMPPYVDEFDTVGLGLFRTTDRWIGRGRT
jgi:hypothetical protein